jgi:hypothetical protein
MAAFVAVVLLVGCGSSGAQVCIEVDGQTTCAATEARVAYECVRDAGIELGPKDRIEPDYWAPIAPGMTLRVVRVEQVQETEQRAVPFTRRQVKTLGLDEGERRILQSGREGIEEDVFLVTLEDGVRVSREFVGTRLVTPPQDEVVAVGLTRSGQEVEFAGTVAYLVQGNAWVMRGAARAERPLTTTGDLDGRVFELSPDGRTLLFTRRDESSPEALNSLWAVTTEVVGAEPEPLGVTGVLRARWSPDGTRIVYTRGEGTEGSPGWRALNDLWVMDWTGAREPTQIKGTACPGAYCWWGVELAWRLNSDGSRVLVADPSSVSEVSGDGTVRPLVSFEPPPTGADWVWVPELSSHPAGAYAALVLPGDRFDLVVMDLADGSVLPLIEGVGMWARPRYTPPGAGDVRLAYAVADDPQASAGSPYTVWAADSDGSEARRVYPAVGPGTGIQEFTWALDGYLLVASEAGLYLCAVDTGEVRPLLEGLAVMRVQWAPLEQ